jgi:AcrR family transcriptional regulator
MPRRHTDMRARKPQQSDLNAYARIRNAALKLFADRGAAASSIRAIAKAAGVSPGMVQHHFKTKQDLQAAIEAYAVEKVMELAQKGLTEPGEPGKLAIGSKIVEFIRAEPDVIRFGRRAVLEDDALGRRLFDQVVAASRIIMQHMAEQGFLRPNIDMDWATLNAMLLSIGPMLFETGFDRHFDQPFRSDEGLARWDVAVDDFLAHGIYSEKCPPSAPVQKKPSKTKPK